MNTAQHESMQQRRRRQATSLSSEELSQIQREAVVMALDVILMAIESLFGRHQRMNRWVSEPMVRAQSDSAKPVALAIIPDATRRRIAESPELSRLVEKHRLEARRQTLLENEAAEAHL